MSATEYSARPVEHGPTSSRHRMRGSVRRIQGFAALVKIRYGCGLLISGGDEARRRNLANLGLHSTACRFTVPQPFPVIGRSR